MGDEIKEILDTPIFIIDDEGFTVYINDKINNYITNLQQDNEKIGKLWREEEAHCILLQQENEKLNDDKRGMLVQLYNANDEKDKIKQENEYLKKQNDEKTKIGVADHKYASQMEDKVIELQQENEEMKTNTIPVLKHNIDALVDEVDELEDYKSRCEKASDKIQYIIDYGFDYDGFNTVESLKGLIDMLVDYAKQSKNILQNGSDSQ